MLEKEKGGETFCQVLEGHLVKEPKKNLGGRLFAKLRTTKGGRDSTLTKRMNFKKEKGLSLGGKGGRDKGPSTLKKKIPGRTFGKNEVTRIFQGPLGYKGGRFDLKKKKRISTRS